MTTRPLTAQSALVTGGARRIGRAIALALAEAGADIVEIGIPYSDPLADGPSIQAATQRALDRGVTPDRVMQMLQAVRLRSDVPLVLMTSYNIVLRYGLDRFADKAVESGADGVILTDLPPEEAACWKSAADSRGLDTIFLAAPTSTPARIALIANSATGFVYCVSRTGVTGARREVPEELAEWVGRVRQVAAAPVCIGFGISTAEHVAQVVAIADGAVIGSALVDYLHKNADNPDYEVEMRRMVSEWKAATRVPSG